MKIIGGILAVILSILYYAAFYIGYYASDWYNSLLVKNKKTHAPSLSKEHVMESSHDIFNFCKRMSPSEAPSISNF